MNKNKLQMVLKPINILRWGKCGLRRIKYSIKEFKRILIEDERFAPLKSLKNSHENERCFIICTGPSLTIDDILLLKDEFTFGMNSICKLFSKIDWRPSVYGIQDIFVFDKVQDDLKLLGPKTICLIEDSIAKKRNIEKKWNLFSLNQAYHDYDKTVLNNYFAYFSDDCYRVVYNGYSITYSLLQFAVYMGFKEIYILGADNNYSSADKHHFIEHGHFASDADKATFRLNAAYKCAKEYADKHGISICNVTRGGMLEVFPRKNLEDILSK